MKKEKNTPVTEPLDAASEEMTVELDLDDGRHVSCSVVTILTVSDRDYIVLLPLNENGTTTVRYGSTVIPKTKKIQMKSQCSNTLRTTTSMKPLQMPSTNFWIMWNLMKWSAGNQNSKGARKREGRSFPFP